RGRGFNPHPWHKWGPQELYFRGEEERVDRSVPAKQAAKGNSIPTRVRGVARLTPVVVRLGRTLRGKHV
ncbi:MAG TPA: hypothetical protein VJK50_00795, partial [Patescibacteria group bacterium]|nr:hypothetical protein [Patescibacteria group bacterium]